MTPTANTEATIEDGVEEDLPILDTSIQPPIEELSPEDQLTSILPELLSRSLVSNFKSISKIYTVNVLPFIVSQKPDLANNVGVLNQIAKVLYLFINIAIIRTDFTDPEVLEEFKAVYNDQFGTLPRNLQKFLEGDESKMGVLPEIRKIVDQALREN